MIKTDVLVIGAGPVGLFAVHQLGIIGLKAEVIDNLDKIGGQCIELYPDKPIYDIPAIPECSGESLTKSLLEQIKPFKVNFHLNERVQAVSREENNWKITTSKKKSFLAPSIIIAGGVGSFEPRKFLIKGIEKFENNGVFYSVKDKNFFKNKKVCIFGGGDSALDWAIELSKISEVILVHRRNEFRGAEHSASVARKLEKEGKLLRENGKEYYYEIRNRFNEKHHPLDFLFLNRSCFNGLMRFNSKGGFNVPFCQKPDRFRQAYITKICNQVNWVQNTMEDKDWQFICQDWKASISNAREEDLIYCDPPYSDSQKIL